MERGFMSKAQAKPGVEKEDSAAALSGPPNSAAALPTPQLVLTSWEDCLELLRSGSDEKRFAGLLLVTKLLPSGERLAIKQVHDAIGDTFISRMLLPLHPPEALAVPLPPADTVEREKQAATCSLGLAVLCSFARVPELAQSPGLLQKLPLLLRVIRAGGVTTLINQAGDRPPPPSPRPPKGTGAGPLAPMDAGAVQDALEYAVAVASSSEQARDLALHGGAVSAALQLLQDPSSVHHPTLLLLVVRLMGALFSGPKRLEVVVSSPSEMLQLLPVLVRVFALPAALPSARCGQQQHPQLPPPQQQQTEGRERQLAALQLETLHVLLLLLPLPLPQGQHLQSALQAAARRGQWPHQIRAGLEVLLRGRVGAVQRHSALQLAAAMVNLVGAQWALGGPFPAAGSGGGGAGPEAFFQLLVEVTRIETGVLLLDALASTAPVPRSSEPGLAAGQWAAPKPRSVASAAVVEDDEEGDEGGAGEESAAMDVDRTSTAGAASSRCEMELGEGQPSVDMESLYRVLESDADRRALEDQVQQQRQQAGKRLQAGQQQQPARGEHERRVEQTAVPQGLRWEGPSERAGDRAARVLPACFELLEACIECLAEDSQRSDMAVMPEDSPSSGGGGGSGADGPQHPPVLPEAVARRALLSLEEAVEGVLQFLEQSRGHGVAVASPLLLASARVLGRFCAEVPVAFGERVQRLLPFLLSLRAQPLSPAARPSAAAEGAGAASPGVLEEELLLPAAEGVMFMLPTMLQVAQAGAGSEIGAAGQRAWLATLADPAVLRQLVLFTCTTALHCSRSVTSTAAQAADDALIWACQLLVNILQSRAVQPSPAEGERGEQVVAGQRGCAADAAAHPQQQQQPTMQMSAEVQITLPVLLPLLLLAPYRPVVSPEAAGPLQYTHHVRLLSAMAALAAVVTAAAASDLPTVGAADPVQLGVLSQATMQQVCLLILLGLQITVQLLQSSPESTRRPVRHQPHQPAAAAAAAAEDEAMRQELRGTLATLATAGLALVERYPLFVQTAAQSAWVLEMLVTGTADGALAELAQAVPAEVAALKHLLRTLRSAVLAAQQAQSQQQPAPAGWHVS